MQTNTTEKEKTALAILRASKVDILDAAILARQALALSQGKFRHTFASYHLAHFKDFSLLQWEIGHRDSLLLRQRYVDMRDVGDTDEFWNNGFFD